MTNQENTTTDIGLQARIALGSKALSFSQNGDAGFALYEGNQEAFLKDLETRAQEILPR